MTSGAMTMGGRVSDKYWSNLMGGGRQLPAEQAPAGSAPPTGNVIPMAKDGAVLDGFADPPDYEAVRSLHTRSNDAYFFVPGQVVPYVQPYAFFQGVIPLPDNSGILILWPGIQFEIRGENFTPAILRLSQRQADVWRVFRPGYHAAPGKGATVIHSIHAVLDDDAEGAALGGSASGLSR